MRRLLVASIVLGLVAGVVLTPATAQAAFGIEPGKVYIDNLYPGAKAEVPITVWNQGDYEATYVVSVREPDYTAEGYEKFAYPTWITITPDQVTITPGGKAETLVVITMPDDADYSGKKAEIWIGFKEKDTAGMVKIEIAARLLISTRVEASEEPTEEPEAIEASEEPAEEPEAIEADQEPAAEPPAVEADQEPAEGPLTIKESGAVGISGGIAEKETVVPIPQESGGTANSFSPLAILSPVLGVVLIGGAGYFLVKRRRRHILDKHQPVA